MKKRLFTTLLGLLVILGSWAENTLVATLTSTATTNISLRLKAVENGVPVQIDWGDGALAEAVVNTASTSLSGKPLGEIKIYGDVTKLTYLLPYNAKITKVDLSGWNGLQVLDFSSNSSLLTELVLPTATNNLLSLNVKSASLTRLDVSSYLKLVTLVCGATKLTELVLPSANCDLKELTCTSSSLTTINTHACNNLEKLDISSNNKMKTFVLPDNKEKFKSLTCTSVAIEGKTLDVSAYVNLNYLYCDYCQLTSLTIPSSPVSGIEIDCSSNYIPMYGLPEVNSTKVYYTPQFCKHELNEKYTTNDLVDLTTAYVRKKGTGYSYNAEGILPTFTWYTESPKKQLIENEDYTVIDGCKFRFSTSIGKSIYCEIANSGYSNLSGQEAFKSTSFILEEALPDPVVLLESSSTRNINLKLKATEDNLPVQIDWGNGILTNATVNTALTTLSGTPAGMIKIYGDNAKLIYADFSSCSLKSADFSQWEGLQTLIFKSNTAITNLDLSKCSVLKLLECASNSKLADLKLPEAGDKLESLVLNNNSLTALDVNRFISLKSLNCKSNPIKQLTLPTTDNQLTTIEATYVQLTSLDISKCSKLKTLNLGKSDDVKLEPLVLPENADALTDLTLMQCGLTSLDVSKYVNLKNLDCTYNYLTSVQIPENPNNTLSVDCSYNYMFLPTFPEGEKVSLYYMEQREKVSKYTLQNSYTTADIVDLSELHILKKGISGSYFAEGVYPTYKWYVEGKSDELVANLDYTALGGGKFKFGKVPEGNVYCVVASSAYPAYQDYSAPYKTTSITIEKAADPIISLTTLSERLIGFSLYATEDNTSMQIDWGDGNMVEKVINTTKTSIQGTPVDTKIIKIYGDAAKLNHISLAYGDYLTDVDLSKSNALSSLEIIECYRIANVILPEDITSLETLNITNSSVKSLDVHNWSALKNLTYIPYGVGTIVLPDNATSLEKMNLGKLSLETIDLSKYINLKEVACNSNAKLTNLSVSGGNLTALEVTSNALMTALDVSSCTKLSKLNCRNNVKLTSLVLPVDKTSLLELNCSRTGLTLDLSGYTNLQVLDCSQIKNIVFPANAEVMTSLTCQETGLTGTLDVSSYVNLKKLDCSYNDLTAILVPENLNNMLDIDCSYNLLRMPNFPEGEKITMSYIFQREKVMKYELKNNYTTDDVIDFSDYYVLKKGIAKSYNAAGVYPTFTWYLEKNNEKLQAGKDYTVTNGCKFQFTKVPDGNVYCVISSKAYPDYTELNIPYKTTVCSISKGTGVEQTDATVAQVYSYNNVIVVIPAEACTYTISSLTGQIILTGETQEEVKIPMNLSGICIVYVKTANRESTYKVAIR